MSLSSLQQPSYAKRLFVDLWKIHKEDHCKGVTFFYRVRDKLGNVTRRVCRMFTHVCPHCITVLRAAAIICKTANATMTKNLEMHPDLVFKLGDIVLVPLDDVDRTKVDGGNLCGVVVTINKDKSTCQVAGEAGTSSPCLCVPCLEASCQCIKQYCRNGLSGCIWKLEITTQDHRERGSSIYIICWGTGDHSLQLQGKLHNTELFMQES
jgi:hypothetical protein